MQEHIIQPRGMLLRLKDLCMGDNLHEGSGRSSTKSRGNSKTSEQHGCG
jgi:hypothetical protein